MMKVRIKQVALAAATLVSLGFAGAASAAAPRPGSQAASTALAFNPFTKASAPAGGSGTLVLAGGSDVVARAHNPSHQVPPSSPPGQTRRITVSISDVTVTEPDSGHTLVQFSVSLSRPADGTVRVDFRTRDGSARGNHVDYEFAAGTLTFQRGEQTKFVTVRIEGDTIPESTEQFFVDLNNARPSTVTIARRTGTGTILDNDRGSRQPQITLAVRGSSSVQEGDTGTRNVPFLVYLSETPSRTVTFRYGTLNGSANANSDFESRSGQQSIPAGATQLSRGFEIPVRGDRARESNETFTARIFDVQNATIRNGSVQITIRNDD